MLFLFDSKKLQAKVVEYGKNCSHLVIQHDEAPVIMQIKFQNSKKKGNIHTYIILVDLIIK